MIFCAEAHSATESVLISARPPFWRIIASVCCAGGRHHDRDLAPDAATGTGDDDDFVYHDSWHGHSPCAVRCSRLTGRDGSRNVNPEWNSGLTDAWPQSRLSAGAVH